MTQAELAKRANLSKGSIGRIERGKYNKGVPISTLLDIAESLRIDLSSLVTFSEEEKKVWWEIDKHMLLFSLYPFPLSFLHIPAKAKLLLEV